MKYLTAVIEGRYREFVQAGKDGWTRRAAGKLEVDGRTVTIGHNVWITRLARGPRYEFRDYAAYEGPDDRA